MVHMGTYFFSDEVSIEPCSCCFLRDELRKAPISEWYRRVFDIFDVVSYPQKSQQKTKEPPVPSLRHHPSTWPGENLCERFACKGHGNGALPRCVLGRGRDSHGFLGILLSHPGCLGIEPLNTLYDARGTL